MPIKPKRRGRGFEIKTLTGKSRAAYIVFRTPDGSFHVFQEVDAKDAARDCGTKSGATTRQMWATLWKQADQQTILNSLSKLKGKQLTEIIEAAHQTK